MNYFEVAINISMYDNRQTVRQTDRQPDGDREADEKMDVEMLLTGR